MIPNKPIVLKGKDAKAFEKYQKRPGTRSEIAYFRKAEEFYLKHCQKIEQAPVSVRRRK